MRPWRFQSIMTKSEHSFGIIPLRQNKVFLIKHLAGHWGFPKGRAIEGESPLQTAERELFEETGLRVEKLLQETPIEEHYECTKEGEQIQKQVTYFLAAVAGDLKLQAEEILEGKWFSLEEASDVLTFQEAKEVIVWIKQHF